MQLISKYNKGIRHLLCEIDIFSKNGWVFPSKDEKGITIFNTFQSILDSSKCKPIKIRVDQNSEFYNSSYKKWLKETHMKIY